MNHPNIVKVTDLIEESDTVAFVMEYIEGETLKDYLERKVKLNDEIKAIFILMLTAVGYLQL
jgi:serine/threonine-protein kinase